MYMTDCGTGIQPWAAVYTGEQSLSAKLLSSPMCWILKPRQGSSWERNTDTKSGRSQVNANPDTQAGPTRTDRQSVAVVAPMLGGGRVLR